LGGLAMCIAIVGKVDSIDQSNAIVDIFGVKTKVNVILVEALEVGDYVLVHTGFAIEKISVEKALSIEEVIKKMIKDDIDG